MNSRMRRWGLTLLSGAIVLGAWASAAHGQVRMAPFVPQPGVSPAVQAQQNILRYGYLPGVNFSQAANVAIMGRALQQVPPWVYGYNPYPSPVVGTSPYGGMTYGAPLYPSMYTGVGTGYPSSATLTTTPLGGESGTLTTTPSYGGYSSGYGYPPYYDPSYGFLSGTADVINAQGNFLKTMQQARLTQTQADESRVDYRRRLIDEARYERGLLPTTEELRQQELARDLDWARHQPPIMDVASGKTLNDLLGHLTSDPTVGKGPDVPIPQEVLDRINVTSPMKIGASLGLLKQEGGRLHWPLPLLATDFDEPRNELATRMGTALSALKEANKPAEGTLIDLKKDLEKLRDLMDRSEMSPTDYITARSYLSQLASTIEALGDENVVSNFRNEFKAKNVAELLDYMKTKGLDFAPAAPGDEGAYRTLQQALVVFDYGASGQASATPPAAPRQP